jgi:hypothetical protein
MDLALEMGCTAEELAHRMTEAELHRWAVYARKKRLPSRRMEYYLAGVMAMLSNGKPALSDFLLFEPKPVEAEAPATKEGAAQAMGAIFGGANVIRIGAKKRKAE